MAQHGAMEPGGGLAQDLLAHPARPGKRPSSPCLTRIQGDPISRTKASGIVRTAGALHKLFTTLAERYEQRAGGYTRVLKSGVRLSDAAPTAYIE